MRTLVDHARKQLHQMGEPPGYVLAVVDENTERDELAVLGQLPNIRVLSNRYDIFLACEELAISAVFCDADFSSVPPNIDICLYQISKERALTHHVFNQVAKRMASAGKFIIEGRKAEGIKTYHKALVKHLGFVGELKKNKDQYSACLSRSGSVAARHELDDKQYSRLREVSVGNTQFISKPGLYGWNKIDQGSALLIDSLAEEIANGEISHPIHSALDLGCGYGYLSMRLRELARKEHLAQLKEITATDNNAGAILAASANLNAEEPCSLGVKTTVIADDCGASLRSATYDLIVCNPPFHRGFDSSRELSEKFLASTARLLAKNGSVFMVVNSFIPIAKLARGIFRDIREIYSGPQFTVFRLR